MSFTTRPVKTKTLAEHLQALRRRLHLELEEVARLVKIQPKYLRALEAGNFQDLPAAVYVKGFLRSLAPVYRVSVSLLLEQFAVEQQMEKNVADEPGRDAIAVRRGWPNFILSSKHLALGTVAILGLFSLAYLYFQISSLGRKPAIELFSPAEDGAISQGMITVEGQTEEGSALYLNGQPIVVDVSGSFRENVSLAPGLNQLVLKSVNKFGREAILKRQIVFTEKEIAGSFTAASDPEQKQLEFIIEVGPGSAWVQIEADGTQQYEGTMLPGVVKHLEARENIVLTTGNAGSTRITLDGRELGVMGKEGESIRNVEFTK